MPIFNLSLPAIIVNEAVIIEDNGSNSGAILIETIGGSPPFTFLWSNGQTSESLFNIKFGVYDLTVTDILGCVEHFTFQVPFVSATNELAKENSNIKLWPTLVSSGEKFKINNIGLVPIQISKINWWNMNGQLLNAAENVSVEANTSITIPVPESATQGVYFVQTVLANGVTSWEKIIVQ